MEVSIFGPGYGECVVLHLCNNNWFIVDSCISPVTHEPVALDYLNELNIEPTAVRQVIATHWHDDHIRGLGQILRTCSNAEFVCSGALKTRHFHQLCLIYKDRTLQAGSGIDEFSDIFLSLRERTVDLSGPKLAFENKVLWKSQDSQGYIWSLSPSDASIVASEIDFEHFIPPSGLKTKKRLLPAGPNHTAVVLLVVVNDFSILLGSDLEEIGDEKMGWTVIAKSTYRPQDKASFFKIPHHGSKNGHHSGVWEQMLNEDPVAALTPFESGSTRLPTKSDTERICSLTDNAYITAPVGHIQKVKRDWTVEKTIRTTVRTIKKINTSFGQIRLRTKAGGTTKVELFGDALPLESIYPKATGTVVKS
jgi:hypothetical protein